MTAISTEIKQPLIDKIVLKVMIPSKTTKGDFHEVKVFAGGEMKCDCFQSQFPSQTCSHIKIVREILKNGEINKLKLAGK